MDSSSCTLFLLSHLHKLLLDIDWEMRVHPSSNHSQSAQWKMNWPKMQSTTLLCPLSSVRRYRLHGFVFIPSALVLQCVTKQKLLLDIEKKCACTQLPSFNNLQYARWKMIFKPFLQKEENRREGGKKKPNDGIELATLIV